MKTTVLCLAFACHFLSQLTINEAQDFRKLAAGVRRKCLAETGTTAELVDEVEVGEFPDDDKLKCYFKCALESFNMISKNNKINFNLMRKVVPDHYKEIGNEMIDSCTDTTGPNRCELAYNLMKCLYYANPVAFRVV